MSRPKKMLPVVGRAPAKPQESHEAPLKEFDACCEDGGSLAAAAPKTRAKALGRKSSFDGLERTVARVEGMDCASCAATVEKRVSQLPGVRRAVVNFAAGRLDAEHDPGIALEETRMP